MYPAPVLPEVLVAPVAPEVEVADVPEVAVVAPYLTPDPEVVP